jgi:hypothetical protein
MPDSVGMEKDPIDEEVELPTSRKSNVFRFGAMVILASTRCITPTKDVDPETFESSLIPSWSTIEDHNDATQP